MIIIQQLGLILINDKFQGQILTGFEVTEVMAEIDVDASGVIDAAEFQDKLKQFSVERRESSRRCRQIFDEIDADSSGFLDKNELVQLAEKIGLGVQLKQPGFLEDMVAQMDDLSTGELQVSNKARRKDMSSEAGMAHSDGMISRDEFLAWYLTTGFTHLEKPHFVCKKLEVPAMEERKALFKTMDDDGSGALETDEARAAIKRLWPRLTDVEIRARPPSISNLVLI
jgi:Ca2+-binding EF-hand superfamily protein